MSGCAVVFEMSRPLGQTGVEQSCQFARPLVVSASGSHVGSEGGLGGQRPTKNASHSDGLFLGAHAAP